MTSSTHQRVANDVMSRHVASFATNTSIAAVRAEVDREIARMARLGQIVDERSALTKTLALEAKRWLVTEKKAEEAEKANPTRHMAAVEGASEALWLSGPEPARRALEQSPPEEAASALRLRAATPEWAQPDERPAFHHPLADLDGWNSPATWVPLPAWPSVSGLHSPSVPLRGAAVETDATAPGDGRRTGGGGQLGQYRVLRTCRVRASAALSSEVVGALEPGRVIEVLARRTLTVPAAVQRKSARRRGRRSGAGGGMEPEPEPEPVATVVRLHFCGGWVSECTASRGLRSLEKLNKTLTSTQPRRQAGVGRHIAERKEASFYSYGVHHKNPAAARLIRPSTPLSPTQARRLGMPMTPAYTLGQLQAGGWRSLRAGNNSGPGSQIDPQRLEASLSNEAFESAFGMDKASFGRLPSFERERRKKILLLVA